MAQPPPKSRPPRRESADQTLADYSESGVDRSLIRWMLELTPGERLQVIQDQVNAIQEFKEKLDSH
jgi:hypothetical protein